MNYTIAGLILNVKGEDINEYLSSSKAFMPFVYEGNDKTVFSITSLPANEVPDIVGLSCSPSDSNRLLYSGECDGACFEIYSHNQDYYVKSWYLSSSEQLYMWTSGSDKIFVSGDMSSQILRFVLWIAYGLMAIRYDRIPIHSSSIVCNGKAYLFLGESGTGKSTHTKLWREYIAGAYLLNDDSPIVSYEENQAWVYGSPWSGKTPCYRQEKYPLGGIVRLSQSPFNKIRQLSVIEAYGAVHSSCPPEFAYDDRLYDYIGETLSDILSKVNVYFLSCLPNREAAELSFRTLNSAN